MSTMYPIQAMLGGLLQATPSGIETWLRQAAEGPVIRAAVIVLVGLPLIFFVSRTLRRAISKRYDAQWGLIAAKVTFYPLFILLTISVLRELGFSLAPLLGAAGILGIALGFASQTSVSNVISGFFLLGEQPFQVEDVIQVGDTTGRVLSVDMLSVKLRTFDNRFVRIPNETIIKSQITNVTRFPIRRADINVSVAYKEDVDRAKGVLLDIADGLPLSMMEPQPTVFIDGFGDSGINLRLAVWTTVPNFIEVKNQLIVAIKRRFDEEEIEIPFPHLSLYAGEASDAFRVALAAPGREADGGAGSEGAAGGEVTPAGGEGD